MQYQFPFNHALICFYAAERADTYPTHSMDNTILDTSTTYKKEHKLQYKDLDLQHFLSDPKKFHSVVQRLHSPTRRPLFGQPFMSSKPPSRPNSFDDLSLVTGSATVLPPTVDIDRRLSKLDSVFNSLHLRSEHCRKRVMCEMTRNSDKYSPLAEILKKETK